MCPPLNIDTPPPETTAPEGWPSCRVCGCWELNACWHKELGPCWWVESDLCSHCKSKADAVTAASTERIAA